MYIYELCMYYVVFCRWVDLQEQDRGSPVILICMMDFELYYIIAGFLDCQLKTSVHQKLAWTADLQYTTLTSALHRWLTTTMFYGIIGIMF